MRRDTDTMCWTIPPMSDYDYDHKLRRLEELEAAHPEEVTPDSLPSGWRRAPGQLSAGDASGASGEPTGRVLPGGGK